MSKMTLQEKLEKTKWKCEDIHEAYRTFVYLMHLNKSMRVGREQFETEEILCTIWESASIMLGEMPDTNKFRWWIKKNYDILTVFHYDQLMKARGKPSFDNLDASHHVVHEKMTEELAEEIKMAYKEIADEAALENEYDIIARFTDDAKSYVLLKI